jgi:diadenosine tetraphosphate (Ap4A) HIT family hydrolase
MTKRTVFQKLYGGELPCYPVYVNNKLGLFSFLDIYPAAPGHVITTTFDPNDPHNPDTLISQWQDLPPRRLAAAQRLAQIIAQRQMRVLDPAPQRILSYAIGYDVPQAHFHNVPSYARPDTNSMWSPERQRLLGEQTPASAEVLRPHYEHLAFPLDLAGVVDNDLADVLAGRTPDTAAADLPFLDYTDPFPPLAPVHLPRS